MSDPRLVALTDAILGEQRVAADGVPPESGSKASSHPSLRAFLGARGGRIGIVMLVLLVGLAIVGPIVWGGKATSSDVSIAYQGSSSAHLLGTDDLGRDVLARTLAATRLTLLLGLAAGAISIAVGFTVGAFVAALGPRLRSVGRRGIEIAMSFPPILLALVLVTIVSPGISGAVVAIGLGAAPGFARLAENCATSVNAKEFVASARVAGVSRTQLIFRYLLPNMAEPLTLAGLAYVAGSIIDISGLSFLGLGVQPPHYDWGTLLASGIKAIYETPWAALAPAIAITFTGIAIVYVGEAFAHALNPRLWSSSGRVRGRGPRAAASAIAHAVLARDEAPADGVLRVEHLDVVVPDRGGDRRLVRDVSLTLAPGQALGIVGETGSGKTLTALSLAQLVPHPLRASFGRLELDGIDVLSVPKGERERVFGTTLAMIFQDPTSSMNPAATIGGQLIDGVRRHGGLSRVAALEQAEKRLSQVRIGDARRALRRYPHQFSGGMQQRVMIAMGLMPRPRLLVADEPTTALDVTVQAQVLAVLQEVKQEGTSIVLISHDLGVVNQLCERIVVMYHGAIVESGPRERVLGAPLHPYTRGLLGSILEVTTDGRPSEIEAIGGRPPAPGEETPGCAFADRCPLVRDGCRAAVPALTAVSDEDSVACFVALEAETAA
ncbi:MAG: peptide transporter ATP-binding protein [Solirubrobacterales bacterium]|nr:peptide transporter ATP-binding protein [Solirubrobacterales bacterium]